MIPKVIHYCWFGRNPLPELAQKCIASWRKYLPDYEIKEWNEDNFDVNIIPYTAEAYRLKKYAFVSDYARFWVLYKYGGLYFDTDVEVIKPLDDIIAKGPFVGCELAPSCETRLLIPFLAAGLGLGAVPHMDLYRRVLDIYLRKHLMDWHGVQTDTVVTILTSLIGEKHQTLDLSKIQEAEGVTIYPHEYFCPLTALTNKLEITGNTRTIHHYTATWVNKERKPLVQRVVIRAKYLLVRAVGAWQMMFQKDPLA